MRLILATMTILAATPAMAQQQQRQCQDGIITATGQATILGAGRATKLAIANWQREVRSKFGERWMDWAKARTPAVECSAAGIGGLGSLQKRCSISGYPCSDGQVADAGTPVPAAAEPIDDADDATTVQRMLARLGYLTDSDVDGNFGPRTAAAVRRFQLASGLRATGEVDEATFERLRARARQ